jgi:hypothetical protein
MKKILDYAPVVAKKMFLICAMLGTVVFTSCGKSAKEKLEEDVTESAKDCPMDWDDGMLCINIVMEGNSVVYYVEIDEYDAGFSVGDLDDPTARKMVKQEMLNMLRYDSDSDVKEMKKLLKDAEYNVIFRLVGKYYNEQRDIMIYHHEF